MSFQNSGNKKTISEINVTPLVDVMLVLLVIFMITAPLMLNGIKLTLPKTKEVNKVTLSTSQVVLSMTRTGDLFIGKEKVLLDELIKVIKDQFVQNRVETLYLRADYGIKYGKVVSIMSYLKKNEIINIALITEIKED